MLKLFRKLFNNKNNNLEAPQMLKGGSGGGSGGGGGGTGPVPIPT